MHTFVQRDGYKGIFLPGYKSVERVDPLSTLVASPQLQFIDHIVGNQPDLQMLDVCNWYEKVLGFHRFWSVDDKQVSTRHDTTRHLRRCVHAAWLASFARNNNGPLTHLRCICAVLCSVVLVWFRFTRSIRLFVRS